MQVNNLNEKDANKEVDNSHPKIILSENKKIQEKKPPNENILHFNIEEDIGE